MQVAVKVRKGQGLVVINTDESRFSAPVRYIRAVRNIVVFARVMGGNVEMVRFFDDFLGPIIEAGEISDQLGFPQEIVKRTRLSAPVNARRSSESQITSALQVRGG